MRVGYCITGEASASSVDIFLKENSGKIPMQFLYIIKEKKRFTNYKFRGEPQLLALKIPHF
jgi:hypothetical protein